MPIGIITGTPLAFMAASGAFGDVMRVLGIFLLVPLLLQKRAAAILGSEFSRLLMIIGGVTVVWGLLSATFFGVVLYKPLIAVDMTDQSRNLIMRISFVMGAIHLSVAAGVTNAIQISNTMANLTNFLNAALGGPFSANTHAIDSHSLQHIIKVVINGDTGYIPVFADVPA